jgi:hypothetical protein
MLRLAKFKLVIKFKFIIMLFSVTIRPMKQETGKRNRNKFPCNYCSQLVYEYARHLTVCHANKKAVAAILKEPKGKRKEYFLLLRQKAIGKHNIDVIDKGEGEVIVGRRSSLRRSTKDYLPCPACNMLFSDKQL